MAGDAAQLLLALWIYLAGLRWNNFSILVRATSHIRCDLLSWDFFFSIWESSPVQALRHRIYLLFWKTGWFSNKDVEFSGSHSLQTPRAHFCLPKFDAKGVYTLLPSILNHWTWRSVTQLGVQSKTHNSGGTFYAKTSEDGCLGYKYSAEPSCVKKRRKVRRLAVPRLGETDMEAVLGDLELGDREERGARFLPHGIHPGERGLGETELEVETGRSGERDQSRRIGADKRARGGTLTPIGRDCRRLLALIALGLAFWRLVALQTRVARLAGPKQGVARASNSPQPGRRPIRDLGRRPPAAVGPRTWRGTAEADGLESIRWAQRRLRRRAIFMRFKRCRTSGPNSKNKDCPKKERV
ncbi:hypothetical protein C8R44DRAFT_743890 [Mycena epipterygia]|nr:hypothetical protein C8R44DRAFT_743890 [Mycena epipterygia]